MPTETRLNINSSDDSYSPLNQSDSSITEVNTSKTIRDTSKEVRPDKLTEVEINEIENPVKGQEVHDTTNNVNKFWNGSEWLSYGDESNSSLSGFMDYNDTTGSIPLVANTWTDIPNDGLGAFTNKTYKPEGITEFLDVSTGYIDTSETELGETILIRNDYKVNPNTNNALLEFRYELGNGGGIYTLEKIVGRLDSGSGQDYRFSLKPDLIYMGDTNTKDNPIKLQLRLSTNGTLTNAGSVIQLIKR